MVLCDGVQPVSTTEQSLRNAFNEISEGLRDAKLAMNRCDGAIIRVAADGNRETIRAAAATLDAAQRLVDAGYRLKAIASNLYLNHPEGK